MQDVSKNDDTLSIVLQIIFLLISAMHIPIVFFVGKEAVLIIVDEAINSSISKGQNHITNNIDVRFIFNFSRMLFQEVCKPKTLLSSKLP
jgi:hypothetical protein